MADDGQLSQADIDALTAGLLGSSTSDGGINTVALRSEAEFILEQTSTVLGMILNRGATISVVDVKEADPSSLTDGFETDAIILRLPFNTGLPGELCIILTKPTAALLCGLMMGGDGSEAYKDEDADAMNELGNQLMGKLSTELGSRLGMSISAGQAQTTPFDQYLLPFGLEGAGLVQGELNVEGNPAAPFRLLFSPPLTAKLTGGSGSESESAADSYGETLGYGESDGSLQTQGRNERSSSRNLFDSGPNVQMLLDINLNVTIELGRTRLSIRKILELGPGSIIELDRLAGEPVDLLVNDKIVAKGEVVVVDEYFGIRILSLVSPEERIKQLK